MRAMRALLVPTAALTLLAACAGDDTTDPPVRPRSFGGDRPTMLQVPTIFDETRTYPLVVILHGFGASGFLQQGYLRLNGIADSHEMLVLAPDGTTNANGQQFWNADPACCAFGDPVDDVAYLGGLIDDVSAAWPVDPARVTVVGHSNGSFMAYRLACDRADVVTAIAGLAGHGTSTPCTPSAPVHVLHIHGTADATVPYDSGTFAGVESPGAIETVSQWATKNGCTGLPNPGGMKDVDVGLVGDETRVDVTAGCATAAADLWTIEGGGHIPSLTPAFPTDLLAWIAAHPR